MSQTRHRARTVISYAPSSEAWDYALNKIVAAAAVPGAVRVCEVGAGANPALPSDLVQERRLDYVLLDSSAEELAKAPDGYETVQDDITAPTSSDLGHFDLIFTRMVAEHVTNARAFHARTYDLLRPGGRALHFFPTLYAPAFLVNKILPPQLSELLLGRLQGGRQGEGRHGKFPAFYRWCRGPMNSQFRRLETIGYIVEEYRGFFGHAGYFDRMPMLKALDQVLTAALVRHPVPWVTSYAFIALRKGHARN